MKLKGLDQPAHRSNRHGVRLGLHVSETEQVVITQFGVSSVSHQTRG
jgi:hypothetical protein